MTPIDHPTCTERRFERGARRGRGLEVAPLPVRRDRIDGRGCFVSFWRPTAAELEQMLIGGAVALTVFGDVQPVVRVEVDA